MRRAYRLTASSAFLTVVWVGLCYLYVTTQVGWPVLVALLPQEIGLVIIGMVAPLALLWAMTLAETRADIMASELRRQVALLLAPPKAALAHADAAADTLQRRATQLAAAGSDLAERLEQATVRLEGALQRAAQQRQELDRVVETLGRQLDHASRTTGTAEAYVSYLADRIRRPERMPSQRGRVAELWKRARSAVPGWRFLRPARQPVNGQTEDDRTE